MGEGGGTTKSWGQRCVAPAGRTACQGSGGGLHTYRPQGFSPCLPTASCSAPSEGKPCRQKQGRAPTSLSFLCLFTEETKPELPRGGPSGMAPSAQDGQPRPAPALSPQASASVRLPSPTTTAAAIIILPNTHPVLIVSWALGPALTLVIPPESQKDLQRRGPFSSSFYR